MPIANRLLLSGAIAGALSTVVFTAIHQILISDIWFALVPMVAAGILCGVSIAWSYGRLFRTRAVGSWLLYNALYVLLFALLGIVSIVLYEPITTVPEVLATDDARNALLREAVPLTVFFILASTAAIWARWGRSLLDGLSVLLTCTSLFVLLGSNISVLGLVHLPTGAVPLVALFFGLLLALAAVYAAGTLVLSTAASNLASRRNPRPVAAPIELPSLAERSRANLPEL
jgi:hypothetical protein